MLERSDSLDDSAGLDDDLQVDYRGIEPAQAMPGYVWGSLRNDESVKMPADLAGVVIVNQPE